MSAGLGALVWHALPVAAIIVDAADRIAEVNGPAEQFLNASGKVLKGQVLGERLNLDMVLEAGLERARSSGAAVFLSDVEVGTSERAPVPCAMQIAPMPGAEGALLILIESREVAGRLGRARQVKSAARSAIGMAEMLAHEIKNPLAGITGAAQLLSLGLGPEDRELTDLIVEETRRITGLLEQVEQFGNLQPPSLRGVNIHDILERARRSAALGFAAHVRLREAYDPSLPAVAGDADQLVQVFLNLLKNAAEAAEDEPEITLRTFYDASLRLRGPEGSSRGMPIQIEIIDNGPGIPPEIRADMFDPFVSGRANGTGLGLALVSKIISEHQGWIEAESVPGRTVFRVSLPVAGPDLAAPANTEEA